MSDRFRILAPPGAAERMAKTVTRRRFLGLSAVSLGGLAVGGSTLLTACSDDGGGGGGATAETAAGPAELPEVGNLDLNLYTWAAYHDEGLLEDFGNVTIDVYASNEEAIAKLAAAQGTAGYDVLVPTGPYIPQLAAQELVQPLDLDAIPNFENIDEPYRDQPWDPGNQYSVCKDWGSTGWIYDNTVLTDSVATHADFIAACQGPASGETSVLDTQNNLLGLYFFANGIDWNTADEAELDEAEAFLVDELAPHIKAFNSYPGIDLVSGNFILSHAWNGDARQGLLSVDNPDQFTWVLGAPRTEIWMDTFAIPTGAPHPENAYAWLNFMLDPENSVTDLIFHGYNTGIVGVQDLVPADLQYGEMIFFDDEQVATMDAQVVNDSLDRRVDIYNRVKAAAG